MVVESNQPLTPDEGSALDAQYRPFPAFTKWPTEVPRPTLWEHDLEQLRMVADEMSPEHLERAQEVAMRAAAFDTGAIEGLYPTDRGLTLTVATQAVAWEEEVDKRSEDARSLFQAQLGAFELVLDLVANKFPKVTQAMIRRLHEEITAAQSTYEVHTPVGPQKHPLPKGEYKSHPNHVKLHDGQVHAYAPVDQTQAEMQRLLDELSGASFTQAHPILQASYAHYAFVAVHPFADGNGRVARALASAYTYRAASVPLLVLANQRETYFSALSAADSGDAVPFVDFTASAVRVALELVTETLKTARAPQPAVEASAFKDMLVVQGDLNHQQLDRVANEFADELAAIMLEQRDAIDLPDGVEIEVMPVSGSNQRAAPPEFRPVVTPSPRHIRLTMSSAPPASAHHTHVVDVFVSSGSDPAVTLLVQDAMEPDEYLQLSLADLQPELSSAARLRVLNFTQRVLGRGLSLLREQAGETLRETGYP